MLTSAPPQEPVKGKYRTPEERERENLRVRAKYTLRAHQRKVALYFKALEIVRKNETQNDISINFTLTYKTEFGQRVLLVGDLPCLGSWDASKGLAMEWNEGSVWSTTLVVPRAVRKIHYKYVIEANGNYTWEWGNNHKLDISVETPRSTLEGFIKKADTWGEGTSPP